MNLFKHEGWQFRILQPLPQSLDQTARYILGYVHKSPAEDALHFFRLPLNMPLGPQGL